MSSGQTHAGRQPIDDDLVRRLVAGQFPRWAGLPVARIASGGTVNAMYRLGDDMVVRLPLGEGGAGDVELEREWLPRVAHRLPTAVPEVLGAGCTGGWTARTRGRASSRTPWRWPRGSPPS
jgi:aminoglycoside phosphotransferase (APT) family kinase protein